MHADHITGTGYLKQLLPDVKSLISRASGAKADNYLEDSASIEFGRHRIKALSTPGHTNGCMTFIVEEQASIKQTLDIKSHKRFNCFCCCCYRIFIGHCGAVFAVSSQTIWSSVNHRESPSPETRSWLEVVAAPISRRAMHAHCIRRCTRRFSVCPRTFAYSLPTTTSELRRTVWCDVRLMCTFEYRLLV